MKKKVIALFLSIVMVLSAMPFLSLTAFAQEGTCGTDATWNFDTENGKLVIGGSGAIADYTENAKAPWSALTVKSIEIGENITAIGDYAFYNCSSAASISIPSGVLSIGKYSFYGCGNLTSVVLPDTVSSLGNSCFRYCNKLQSINFPASLEKIGEYAFGWCAGLKNIQTQAGLKEIGAYAFYLCDSLSRFDIPSTATTFGEAVFYYCRNLLKIEIPQGATAVTKKMFGGCESLASVTLPSSIQTIGEEAFLNCSNLTSVNVPSAVTEIGPSAFSGCEKLPGVTIPDAITVFKTGVFENCYALKSINFPAGITAVEESAFDGCRGLTDIYYYGTAAAKKSITVAMYNSRLGKVTWHFAVCESSGHTATEWKDDGVHHYHICEVCEEVFDYGEHTGGTATLSDKPICETCENEYGEVLENITVSGEIVTFGSETDEVLIQFFKKDAAEPSFEVKKVGNTVEYSLQGIEPGEYTVKVSKPDNAAKEFTLTVVDRNVTFDAAIKALGDANGSGSADKLDMVYIKQHLNKTKTLAGYDFEVMDMNSDGAINKFDLIKFKKLLNKTQTTE